jgi:hypothetical protein
MKSDNAHSQDTLDADTVEGFLRQNETGVLVRNGGMSYNITSYVVEAEFCFVSCDSPRK